MATGSGPIQYDELFNSDVNSKLIELDSIVSKLNTDFQGLGSTIESMSGTINTNMKANTAALKDMADSLKTVDVTTRGAGATMTDYAKTVDNSTKKSADLKNQQDALNQTFNLATASVDEIKARVKLLTAEYTALGSATDANKAKAQSLSSEVIGLKNQQELLTSALQKTKNGMIQGEGSYNQMSITLNKLRADLKEIPNAINQQTGAWNKNNPLVKEHLEKITQLDGALKKVDGSMGVHTREVGDYANKIREAAQDMLPFGSELGRMGQALHDLSPVISEAVGSMGTLAIGAIGVGSAIAAIVAVPVVAWFKGTQDGEDALLLTTNQLESSWNHAKEAVENFGRSIVNVISGKSKSSLVNDYVKEIGKTFNGFLGFTGANLIKPAVVKDGDAAKVKEITDLQIKIQKNEGDLPLAIAKANDKFQIQRDILSDITLTQNKQGKELEEGMKKRKDAYKEAVDASNEIKNLKVDELKDQRTLLELQLSENKNDAAKRENQNKIKIINAAIFQADADAKKEQTRITRTFRTLEVQEIKDKETAEKAATDAEKKRRKEAEAARLKAIADADKLLQIETKTTLSKLEQKEVADLSNAGTEEEKYNIIVKFEQDKLKVIEDGITKREALYKKDSIQYKELEAEKTVATTASEKAIQKETEDSLKRQQALREKYAKLNDDIAKGLNKGKTDEAVFAVNSTVYKGTEAEQESQKQDALYKIKHDALLEDLKNVEVKNAAIKDSYERDLAIAKDTIDAVNALNDLSYANDLRIQQEKKKKLDEIFGYLKQNTEIISQLFGSEFGSLFDNLTTGLEKFVKGTGVTIDDWANTAKAGIGSIDQAFKQSSDLRVQQLDMEKQAQIDIAGTNKTARLAIEKEFNEKIRQEKIKQARIDKAAALFDIGINTAVAVLKVTSQVGVVAPFVIPAIIALGLIQAAAVAARPIPGFRTGTQNAPEGFARVAEDGPEIIENRGKMRIAHKEQLTYLERGDKVFTADQTRKILDTSQIDSNTELHGRLANNLHQQSSEQRIREMSIAFRQDPEAIGDAVGRRISKLPIHQTYFDERGVTRFIRENGTTTKYLNDRTTLR